MTLRTRTTLLDTADATCRLGQDLAAFLRPGDVILLVGNIGAGKTHFARCLIQASLNKPEDVPSPTYTIIQSYAGVHGEIWHADLYRLTDADEAVELGLMDAFSDAICLVEWPDRLGDMAPKSALELTFEPTTKAEARNLTMRWSDNRWDRILREVHHV